MLLILNCLLPIFVVITLGILLKQFGWIDDSFINASDRLIYYILFPCLLFWKTGKPAPDTGIEVKSNSGGLMRRVHGFLDKSTFFRLFNIPDYQVGSFSQSCYRFSSYIGTALTFSALGADGVRTFGVLIGFVIPFINVLAVSSMIWYSNQTCPKNSERR